MAMKAYNGRLASAVVLPFALWALLMTPFSVARSGPADDAADIFSSAITSFTLDNGMQAIVIEDHRAPVVTHMLWYHVGAADEAPGQSGVAHFLEHLMFKGTEKIASGRFSKIVAENGGHDNAFTSYDYTAYFQRIAADRLELVMQMEADRMRNLRLSEDDVARERDVVLEERSQRTDSNDRALFFEQLNNTLYFNHPYANPVIGWRSEIEALSREAALDFYHHYYAPNNAVLIVVGDVDPGQVEESARKIYGVIPASGDSVTRMPRPVEPPHLAARRLHMHSSQVQDNSILRYYLTPANATAEGNDAQALEIMAAILGGSNTSKLYQELVREGKWAVDASAWYQGGFRDYGIIGIYAMASPDVSLDELEKQLDATIEKYIASGPTQDEMKRAKNTMVADFIYARDNQAAVGRIFGAALLSGLEIADLVEWPKVISSLQIDDVKRVASRWLDKKASVTGWLTVKDYP